MYTRASVVVVNPNVDLVIESWILRFARMMETFTVVMVFN